MCCACWPPSVANFCAGRRSLWLGVMLVLLHGLPAAAAPSSVLPESWGGPRTLFFVYEVAFFVLAASLLTWHRNCQAVYWMRSVSLFVMLYYGLWASVDAFLLATGADVGFLFRVLPNWLYYGGLIGAIAWMAPSVPRLR